MVSFLNDSQCQVDFPLLSVLFLLFLPKDYSNFFGAGLAILNRRLELELNPHPFGNEFASPVFGCRIGKAPGQLCMTEVQREFWQRANATRNDVIIAVTASFRALKVPPRFNELSVNVTARILELRACGWARSCRSQVMSKIKDEWKTLFSGPDRLEMLELPVSLPGPAEQAFQKCAFSCEVEYFLFVWELLQQLLVDLDCLTMTSFLLRQCMTAECRAGVSTTRSDLTWKATADFDRLFEVLFLLFASSCFLASFC
jgi:hypothetical protein